MQELLAREDNIGKAYAQCILSCFVGQVRNLFIFHNVDRISWRKSFAGAWLHVSLAQCMVIAIS